MTFRSPAAVCLTATVLLSGCGGGLSEEAELVCAQQSATLTGLRAELSAPVLNRSSLIPQLDTAYPLLDTYLGQVTEQPAVTGALTDALDASDDLTDYLTERPYAQLTGSDIAALTAALDALDDACAP